MLWCNFWTLVLLPFSSFSIETDANISKICEVEDLVEYFIKQRLLVSARPVDNCNSTLSISGTNGSIRNISLCGKNGSFTPNIKHVEADVGDIKYIILDNGNEDIDIISEIEIYKGSRFWKFNNSEESQSGKVKLFPEGNKPYVIELKTGSQIGAEDDGNVRIKMIGDKGQSGMIYLSNHLKRGSVNIYHIMSSDVGELKSIIISNDSITSPWYCVRVAILYNDKKVIFDVNRWIGGLYQNKISVTLGDFSFAQEITCSTRLVDVFPGIPTEKLHSFTVKCPLNCPKEKVEGYLVHPSNASICTSGVVDGIISFGGGEINVTVGPQLPRYISNTSNSNTVDYEPFNPISSFYMYKIESIDDIDSKVRLVNGKGEISSIGRLEIFDETSGNWGTVCGSGKNTMFNSKAAHLICNHLGFETGERVYTGCSDVYGDYMCAQKGYPVSLAGLGCFGNEKSISQCVFEKPTLDCLKHKNDVVIHCRKKISSFADIKLVNHVSRSNDIGRLEINIGGYRPICSNNWSRNEALVACSQLGYASLKDDGCVDCYCEDVNGLNYCSTGGNDQNPIQVSCRGHEQRISECKIEEIDEHECNGEVVLGCSEKELAKMDVGRLHFPLKPRKVKLQMSCYDTAADIEFDSDNTRVVECPSGCRQTKSLVNGTLVYSADSSICKAAIHSGVFVDGGDVLVKLGGSVKHVFGTSRNGIVSLEGIDIEKVFTLSHVSAKISDKVNLGINSNSRDGGSTATINRAAQVVKDDDLENADFDKMELDDGSELKHELVIDDQKWAKDTSTGDASHLRALYTLVPKQAFTGGYNSWIDITGYDFWTQISATNIFSISLHFKPVSSISDTEQTLLSLGNCGGLILKIDDGRAVIEQICHTNNLITHQYPIDHYEDMGVDDVIHLLITYHGPSKSIALYVNGYNVIHKTNWATLSLTGPKYIGRLGVLDADYFIGQIYNIQFFDHILTQLDSRNLIKNFTDNEIAGINATNDGKIHCVKHYSGTVDNGFYDNLTMSLACSDDLSVINGYVGQTFSVFCGSDCSDMKWPLKGSVIYSPDSSICKAAMHSGAGDHILLKLLDGLPNYKSTKGHNGIVSCGDENPHMISFTVSPRVTSEYLSCTDDAMWILNLPIGSKHIVMCPKDCQNSKARVFGTDIYSPNSSVCMAAIHCKDIKGNMRIEVEVAQGLSDYKGTKRNGIESQACRGYLRSFKILSVDKC